VMILLRFETSLVAECIWACGQILPFFEFHHTLDISWIHGDVGIELHFQTANLLDHSPVP
jgi:hypothetical protein